MKTSVILIVICALWQNMIAQPPEKMSYQAIIRDTGYNLVSNQSVGIQVSILQGSPGGTAVYVETQTQATNSDGLLSIEIGSGTQVTGNFSTIDWSKGTYFIKTETDTKGGTNYTITVISQVLSVPYALYAKSAETISGSITETDPVFGAWDKNYNDLTNKPDFTVFATKNMANQNITDLANPVYAGDAATKAYVDVFVELLYEQGLLKVKDAEGNNYDVVKIGSQFWMAENLRYLPNVVDQATGSNTIPYCYVNGYNGTDVAAAKATTNYAAYGVLYNWPAAMNGAISSTTIPSRVQGLCPNGWHLPSDAEWSQLTTYLGGNDVAGGKLKETGTTYWSSPNSGATNESGFTALPGGGRAPFLFPRVSGYWWSATGYNTDNAWYRRMDYNNSGVYVGNDYKKESGFSVRCVRN